MATGCGFTADWSRVVRGAAKRWSETSCSSGSGPEVLDPDLVTEPEITDEVLPVPCMEDQPASVADTGSTPETEQEPPAAPPEATGEGSGTPTPHLKGPHLAVLHVL